MSRLHRSRPRCPSSWPLAQSVPQVASTTKPLFQIIPPIISPQAYPGVFKRIAHFCNPDTLVQLSWTCTDLLWIRNDRSWGLFLEAQTARLWSPWSPTMPDWLPNWRQAEHLGFELSHPGLGSLAEVPEVPANFQDPRNWDLYSSLPARERLELVVTYMRRASKKIIAECEAGAGTLKQSFIGMLEANGHATSTTPTISQMRSCSRVCTRTSGPPS